MECIKPFIWEITAFCRSQVTCIVLHRVVWIPKRRWGWAGTPGHLKRLYINEHFPVWKWKTHFWTPEMLRKNVFESPENQTPIQPIEAICPQTGRSYVAAVAWGGLLSSRANKKSHGETLSLDGQGLKLWISLNPPSALQQAVVYGMTKARSFQHCLTSRGPRARRKVPDPRWEVFLGAFGEPFINPIGAFRTAQRNTKNLAGRSWFRSEVGWL